MLFLYWITLFLAFYGWGRGLVSFVLREKYSAGIPATTVLGMCLTLQFASLCLWVGLHSYVPFAWSAWVALGSFYGGVSLAKRFRPASLSVQAPGLILILAWIPTFYAAFADISYNCHDDHLAYFTHIKMILQSGSLVDPFSLRRLASYGGQQMLQSFFILPASETYLNLFEKAFLHLLAGFLILSVGRALKMTWPAVLLGGLFLWAQQPRINTAPTNTALVMVLAWVVLHLPQNFQNRRSLPVIKGILISSLCFLRANYIVAAAFLGVWEFFAALRTKKDFKDWGLCWGLAALLTASGAYQLWISSGTPFFPLFHGNYSSAYGTFEQTSGNHAFSGFISQLIESSDILNLVFCFFLLLFTDRGFPFLLALAASSLGLFVSTAFSLRHANGPWEIVRYSYPFLTASALCILLQLGSKWREASPFRKVLGIAGLASLSLPMIFSALMGLQDLNRILRMNPPSLTLFSHLHDDPFVREREIYRQAQAAVPPGALIATMVEKPFLLDYGRNPIRSLDIIGNVSPGAGFNPEGSIKDFEAYFRSQNIHYLLFEDPEAATCEYSRKLWRDYVKKGYVDDKDKNYAVHTERALTVPSQVYWAPRYLKFFDSLEREKSSPLTLSFRPLFLRQLNAK